MIWFPYLPLEVTVRNKFPAIIFSLGTLFLTVISRGTLGNHIFRELVARKKVSGINACNKVDSSRFPSK
jgi:hypothetical protein